MTRNINIRSIAIFTHRLKDYINVVRYIIRYGYTWASGSTNIMEKYWTEDGCDTCIVMDINTHTMYYDSIYSINFDNDVYAVDLKCFHSKIKYLQAYKELI